MDPLVLLVPIQPAPNGVGLAQRAATFVRAASRFFDVTVCVVPSAGEEPYRSSSPLGVPVIEVPVELPRGHRGSALAGSPEWQRRLARSLPFPPLADRAPPTLAGEVVRALRAAGIKNSTPIHTMRAAHAPLAVATAELLESRWTSLDLDDDDEALMAAGGSGTLAASYHRLVATFAPEFDALCAASPPDAAAISLRHGLEVEVVPNGVETGDFPRDPVGDPPLLLFVGNLTYGPNIEAAARLAGSVLPLVQARLRRTVNVALVGPVELDGPLRQVGRLPGVEVTGYVDDLSSYYQRAAAVVVPLALGAGTSIKCLEAFARGTPVVASATAVRGLTVRDAEHYLIAESVGEMAAGVCQLIRDPELGVRLATAARAFVEQHHEPHLVEAEVVGFLRGAARRARPASPRS